MPIITRSMRTYSPSRRCKRPRTEYEYPAISMGSPSSDVKNQTFSIHCSSSPIIPDEISIALDGALSDKKEIEIGLPESGRSDIYTLNTTIEAAPSQPHLNSDQILIVGVGDSNSRPGFEAGGYFEERTTETTDVFDFPSDNVGIDDKFTFNLWENRRGFVVPRYGAAFTSPEVIHSHNQLIEFALDLLPTYPKLQDAYGGWMELTKQEKLVVRNNFMKMSNTINSGSQFDNYNNSKSESSYWNQTCTNQEQQETDIDRSEIFLCILSAFNVWNAAQTYRGACGYTSLQQETTIYEDQLRHNTREQIYEVCVTVLQLISQLASNIVHEDEEWW